MADSTEPKKETMRITLPPQQNSPSSMPVPPRDTVRIHLPSYPPANPASAPPGAPSPPRAATAGMPGSPAPPLKETARITVLSDAPAKPAVQMEKTQPWINLPPVEKPVTSVTAAQATPQPPAQAWNDQVPTPICWALVAISATVLILQIWNYLS